MLLENLWLWEKLCNDDINRASFLIDHRQEPIKM